MLYNTCFIPKVDENGRLYYDLTLFIGNPVVAYYFWPPGDAYC